MSGISSFLNRLNIIRQIPVFSKLSWLEQQRIARKSMVVEYKKGDLIAKEGAPPDYFYCLISGRLHASTLSSTGLKDHIDFIHRGMYFGIISLLTGENHSQTFEALNDSVVLQISKKDFYQILQNIPQLGIQFSQSLSQGIRRKVKGTKNIFENSIISIYSPVKGTGSSTYAINLALNLEKETKKKVIFVNIHPNHLTEHHEASMANDATPRWKAGAVDLGEIVGDYDKIVSSIRKGQMNIDLINVTFDPKDESAKRQVSPLVSTLVGDYHYVVVDLPNDMDDVVMESLTQADQVHLIIPDRKKDLDLIKRIIDRLEMVLKESFREERIKVIIRAVHAKVYLSFEEIDRSIDYHVYTMLPQIQTEDLTVHVKSDVISFYRCHDHSEYTKTIRRIARDIGGVMVGLVLGGGAALGVAHVGVIRVLEQENIPIDMVVGSSMGALVGAIWTMGRNAEEVEKVAREFEKKKDLLMLFDPPFFPISGLVRGQAIRRWLKKHLGNTTFYGVKIPFKVVAYDLIRREELVIEGGSLVDGVRKSIAIPGVIPPIQEKGQWIIDGGVLNPLPTNVLASRGIKKIIAVNVLQSPEHVCDTYELEQQQQKELAAISFRQSPLQYILFRLGRTIGRPFNPNISDIIVRTLQASEYVIAQQSAHQADVVIHPDLVGINWFELYKVEQLIKAGETATRQHLPAIKKLIEE